jgi:peptidoglycan/LPS O-acetylase OafA/YrhL
LGSSHAGQAEGHRDQLDGLRFVAFLSVFVYHSVESEKYKALLEYGGLGVQLFFALSGFLITRILLQSEGESLGESLRTFYLRRVLRIFPLYYAVLLGLAVARNLEEPLWQFLYVQNWLQFKRSRPIWPYHFWSLCVEEQFYLLYPLILLATPRRWRVCTLLGLLGLSVAARVLVDDWKPGGKYNNVLLPTSGVYLLWGGLAGYLDLRLAGRKLPGTSLFAAGFGLFAAALVAFDGFHLAERVGAAGLGYVEQTLIGVGFALGVFGLWTTRNRALLAVFSFRPVAYLGKISYGLYVYHLFVIRHLGSGIAQLHVSGLWRLKVPLAFGITVLVAMLSWHLFEFPINNLKRFFPYGKPRRHVPREPALSEAT